MKKYIVISLMLIVFAVIVFVTAEKFPTYLLESGQVKALISAANKGDKNAMWDLYFHFDELENKDNAMYWLRKGAYSGDSRAQYHLYALLKESRNQSEKKEAFEALKLAANQGDSFASLQLGKQFIDGVLVERSVELGKKWFKTAALSGNIEAMLVLSDLMAKNCEKLDKAYGFAMLANDMSGKSKTYQIEANRILMNIQKCVQVNQKDMEIVEQKGKGEFIRLKKMLSENPSKPTLNQFIPK